MLLSIHALSCPSPDIPQNICAQFGPTGGRIGRGPPCKLILPDPNRHTSREHAEICFLDGAFSLKVVSRVNSLLVNDALVGPGETVKLNHGDQILIGEYLLQVEISEHEQPVAPLPISDGNPFDVFDSLELEATKDAAPGAPEGPEGPEGPDWFRRPAAPSRPPPPKTIGGTDLDEFFDSPPDASHSADLVKSRPDDIFKVLDHPVPADHGLTDSESPEASPLAGSVDPDDIFKVLDHPAPADHRLDQFLGLSGSESPEASPLAGSVDQPLDLPLNPSNPSIMRPPGPTARPIDDALGLPPTTESTPQHPEETDARLGAAAPGSCAPGSKFIAHFVAYPSGFEAEMYERLRRQSPNAQIILDKRSCRWASGTQVTVRMVAPEFEVFASEQSFFWQSTPESLDFAVAVPMKISEGATILIFEVEVEGFRVATVCLNIVITTATGPPTRAVSNTRAARTAFASYAAKDRALVAHMIGAISRSAGIDVFLDCLDLNANEVWKQRLEEEIASRDLFLLFWSKRAKDSPWVEWEWRTALSGKGKQAIQVHSIEPNVAPPFDLSDLHFGSVHALVADYHSKRHRPWRADLLWTWWRKPGS